MGKFVNVMARGPDAQPRRRAQHNGTHALGSKAIERGDDAAGGLGAEDVAPALVVKGYDANLPAFIGPDGAAREASSPSRAACPAIGPRRRGLLSSGPAPRPARVT